MYKIKTLRLLVVMFAVFVQQTEGVNSAARKHKAFGLSEEELDFEAGIEKRLVILLLCRFVSLWVS